MNEDHYSNREIDAHFKEIKEVLARIETQTTKTNGRVSKLENWKAWVVGYAVAITPIVAWLANEVLSMIKK